MTVKTPSTRRDARFRLRSADCFVELAGPRGGEGRVEGVLRAVSASGLTFDVAGVPADFARGAASESIVLRIDDSIFTGKIVVRSAVALGAGRIEVGCLFHPDVQEEERWSAFISGIRAGLEIVGGVA